MPAPAAGRCAATLALALALIASAGAPAAATLPADTTAIVSGTPDLLSTLATPDAGADSTSQAVSRDGRLVAFTSRSDGLFAGDDDDVSNVYVTDMATGVVTLVSRDATGAPSTVDCSDAVISDDGTHVAFVCHGALVPGVPGNTDEVYERDLTANTTTLVSRVSGLGAAANAASDEPAIDATGAHVAFRTHATNLGDGAPASPALDRIYRRTIGSGDATVLVSRGNAANADPADQDSEQPSIDNSGQHVAFATASTLDAGDTNGVSDVYVRDVAGGTTTLASRVGAAGAVGNGESFGPRISGNGLFVAFTSDADNFDPTHDATDDDDVYRRSPGAGTTELVDAKADGATTDLRAQADGIDDSGSTVAFEATAATFAQAVLVRTAAGVQPAASGSFAGAAALSGDGATVAFDAPDGTRGIGLEGAEAVRVRALASPVVRTASIPPGSVPFTDDGGRASGGSVSADGRFVAFVTNAPALGVPTGEFDVAVVRDTVTGAVTVVNRQDGADGAIISGPVDPQISADGRRVAFLAFADTGGPEGTEQLYVRDIPSGRTFIASRAEGIAGALANRSVEQDSFTISGDGSRVAFLTPATNLSPDDADTLDDVYVRDVDTGHTLLVSRAAGLAGAKANDDTETPMVSGDGRFVVFATDATNLGLGARPGDAVYVRMIDTGALALAAVAPDGTPGDEGADLPSISADGNRISFVSDSRNLGPVLTGSELLVRDRATNTTMVASVSSAGAALRSGDLTVTPRPPMLSGDGTSIVFVAQASTPVAPGDPGDGLQHLFVRDLTGATTRLVSRGTGPDSVALPASADMALGGITADGSCVTFQSSGRVLAPPSTADFEQVYMRVLRPDCGRAPATTAPTPVAPVVPRPPVIVDRTAPKLSTVRLSRSRFRIGTTRGRGTVLSLHVSEAARLTVTVQRQRPGRRGTHRGKPTCTVVAHVPKHGACVAYSTDGTLTRAIRGAATVRIAFSGRLGTKRLALGRHRLTLVARDAAGNASRPVSVSFTVVA